MKSQQVLKKRCGGSVNKDIAGGAVLIKEHREAVVRIARKRAGRESKKMRVGGNRSLKNERSRSRGMESVSLQLYEEWDNEKKWRFAPC